ncbi:MAG TPA: hypothetical protein VHA15_09550, partial [Burkholderiales bacterium]|nr:hypothetical protein [Burkholderiales bacterium]
DQRRKMGIERGKEEAFALLSTAEQEKVLDAERLTNLSFYLEQANLSKAEADALIIQAQLEHEAKLGSISAQAALERRKFAELNAKQQAQTYIGILTNLTASTASKNREMFELNRVASMANAIIYTYEGANKALGQGGIFGLGMAGLIIAAGLANVANIASTEFGTGAAPSAGGGGAGVTPVNQVPTVPQGGGQTTFLTFRGGDRFSQKDMRELATMMIESQKKGGRFVLVD